MAESRQVNDLISIERQGDIALICIDNPPVNATGQQVREGLQKAVEQLNAEGGAKVIAIYAAGRTFVAGADIKEFGKPPQPPALPDVFNIIEDSEIPVTSVMHGTALGGGFELGLATHARIGIEGLRVGLPEINLGLLPGAGGTQRVPRLAGIPMALDMALSGRMVPAQEALEKGLIDRLEAGDPRDVAIAAAQDVLDGKLQTRRTCDLDTPKDDAALEETATMLRKKQPHMFSPHKIVEAVRASYLPRTEGMAIERQAFVDSMDTPQRAGMIHAFFGERAVSGIPEAKGDTRPLDRIGVIGGGTMGSGIATSCLLAGIPVTLVEVAQDGLDRGVATITKNIDGAVSRGKLAADKRDAVLGMLTPTLAMEELARVDLVIEAVFEKMDVKRDIFGKLDGICKQGAVLASNTSYLDINEIAACTSRPQDVLGLHFFSPAHVMRLLEIVQGEKTAADVLATGFALAKKLKKVGVLAQVCDGFIGNRILAHYSKAASYLVLDGASPQQVDDALEGFGFAMGPHKVGDLAGLDIGWMTRKRKADTRDPNERYAGDVADRICENGWFGRKTGKGYYVYEGGAPVPNPEVATIIDTVRTEKGITPREFTDQEIIDRYMTAMISEAARVVEDGTAKRPVDVDMVFLFGYGFPRFRGGPLHYADTIGAAELVERIKTYAKEDPHYWQVPPILEKMAQDGTKFADLN
ncbi:3-hydroxyacyl-CoA dehydrogenase NAD-binding domain-containing protein [Lutimaribacter sp. EGI FJ00015]|uniref:3-hydroxyacyl-CoA dehydrogenase NAD-binding domain-containing protein n=1 Tax=Lutimaribacter degradans TaxID=2945989 RepID=A0ACC5ZTZ5_9RHOB|nr:3-hydroxyacyl-CoA dehydrogenase NAD-binding domain-containing protein [Lutimaribacter sp. EGI FJ00013]MCM2561802.1 3-hydroxyacyl-CoA dehydrogenase NAD-binding domain-containing protein [Lutimaribacter sp. EGI FJ00013]MCO0613165.1 3-hydroxyacyl-CoA dehydrogenase NAD-binding domain-containing protein [Lutimaribacter sp. EGI FJ00015]MCO0635635.1 3-hydroxyacyl-CoA dehydrogenase NAD-binding domain-containing protein [Lutimaribacter sp. EGI FJ00014]